MEEQSTTGTFHIVFMCTGNQARSVIAEHYTRKITAGLPVEVESCGTMDIPRAPALPEAIEVGRALGLDLEGHGSRCYTAIELSKMDLVIGFDQNHIATAVVEGGAAPDKTFKLLELARLVEREPTSARALADAARETIRRAAALRSSEIFTPGEEVADPAGRDPRFFQQISRTIQTTCDVVFGRLFPAVNRSIEGPPEGTPELHPKIWGSSD